MVLDCVKQAGWELVKVGSLFVMFVIMVAKKEQTTIISLLQGQVRRKEDQCTGSIWDCLPITEKAKDEIYFSGLSEEVRSHFWLYPCKYVQSSLVNTMDPWTKFHPTFHVWIPPRKM